MKTKSKVALGLGLFAISIGMALLKVDKDIEKMFKEIFDDLDWDPKD